MASAEAGRAMKPMPKSPNNSVPQDYLSVVAQDIVNCVVQGKYCGVGYVIADLPAYASARLCNADDLRQHFFLSSYEIFGGRALRLVGLPDAIWRGCDGDVDGVVGHMR